MLTERIIGKLTGNRPGNMLIAIGGMHGNEHVGVSAIAEVFRKLSEEKESARGLEVKGCFLGLIGNRLAWEKAQRYIKKDLNRQWDTANIHRIYSEEEGQLDEEDLELKALLSTIGHEIAREKPRQIIIIDLHTTSAEDGNFTIIDNHPQSLVLANVLGATIVRGLINILEGTAIRYFTDLNLGLPTTAIAYEAGQHNDPAAFDRSISAIMGLLHFSGIIPKREKCNVQHHQQPPMLCEITYTHHVRPDDKFYMNPGYRNFQPVREGEIIASDKTGDIRAPYFCRILMPLYQDHGSEGFFLVKEVPF